MSDSESAGPEHRGTEQSTEPAQTDSPSSGRRDIVVPLRLYKTITVFSTLIATICILTGFILLDAATLQVSVLRTVFLLGFETVGLTISQDVFSVVLGIGGLTLMALGAGVFVLSSRFRAEGMGNSQEDTAEE